ncbi:MAG: hypothetical protein K1Y02_18705 [Candidatus Hydrogenedentes bacterium]|nr:hypothetical protein [Candidatus Hydrogenedentota bacterium]
MSEIHLVPLVMRWMHILAAITAVGGVTFLRFVLIPAAERVLDDSAHAKLRESVIKRWQKLVHLCILLFLVSGFYNYLMITRHDHAGQALYHALFGIKFLLALGVFALAVALTSLKQWSAGLRAKSKTWLAVLFIMAVGIVLISSTMKQLPKTTVPPIAPAPAANT